MGRQFGLKLERSQSFGREAFILGASNAVAIAALDARADWPGGVLALAGPAGCGKTHLAFAWAEQNGALFASAAASERLDLSEMEGRLIAVDDADRVADETLFHLINLAAAPGGALLLTARDRPAAWTPALPDLRSRLNALSVAELLQPDDVVLRGVLDRFFRQRAATPSDEVLDYLVKRIERSAVTAREVVARVDEAALSQGRPISIALARKVLEDAPDLTAEPESGELFP